MEAELPVCRLCRAGPDGLGSSSAVMRKVAARGRARRTVSSRVALVAARNA